MKILHIIQRYSPAYGGSEIYMKVVSEYFAKENQVEVWTSDALDLEAFWDLSKRRIEKKNEIINNVLVRRFSVAPSILSNFWVHKIMRVLSWRLPFNLTKILSSFPYVFGMLKYGLSKRLWDFDVIQVTASPYNILFKIACIVAKRSNAKLIVTPFVHLGEGQDDPIRKYYFKPETVDFYKKADLIFVQTEAEKNAILQFCSDFNQKINRKNFKVIGMGVNPLEIGKGDGKRFRKKYEIKKNEKIVFYLGAKLKNKGVLNLIKACKILWKSGENFRLVLAGMTSEEFVNYWKKLKPGIKEKIISIDSPSESEKWDLFDAGDIFSMVSRSDSFGIVYLEAWYYKKPVLGCAIESISEIITHEKDGLLSKFNDRKQLAKNIRLLLRNDNVRKDLGQNGYKKVLNQYTWKKKLVTISSLYTRKA